MVGTGNNGDIMMISKDVEATPGDMIDAVRAAASSSLRYKPNVVLINAGTNDCRLDHQFATAGDRMRALINTLLEGEDIQGTAIILSTLIPSDLPAIEVNRNNVNAQYRALVTSMRNEGVSIVLADMDPRSLPDNTHPGDAGYGKMATVWAKAIEETASENLIKEPVESDAPGQVCETDYGDGLTQRGSGVADGTYYQFPLCIS
ncbi:hypothetical protein BDV12DRAFT_201504 [Aspergillus spectabilis]